MQPTTASRSWVRWFCAAWLMTALATPMTGQPPTTGLQDEALNAWLAEAELHCETMKSWGHKENGEPWLLFDISCLLPHLPASVDSESVDSRALGSEWVAAQTDPDRRFVAAATLVALGRRSELSPVDRATFAMELARRENEPFASANIGFGFGERAWWDLDDPKNPDRGFPQLIAVGQLTAPLEAEMVPVIRSYLFQEPNPQDGVAGTRVSTLAVYTLSLMVPQLDRSIASDLRRVLEVEPGSLESDLAGSILEAIGEPVATQ